jgi:hypothetical protein
MDKIILESIDFQKLGINAPEIKNVGEGGLSGASIFIVIDSTHSKKYILKIYPNDYYVKNKNRIIRELDVYLRLSEEYPYNKTNLGSTKIDMNDVYNICDSNDTNGIGFPKLVDHGEMENIEKPNYYILITFVDGIVLSKSILPKNSSVWKNQINVGLFAAYFLKSLRYLNNIFGGKFLHYDLHPDNIYVVFENNKLVKVTLIDFDLVDANLNKFKTIKRKMTHRESINMNLLKTFKQSESYIPLKTRAFICYCFNQFRITNKSKLTYDYGLCPVSHSLISYGNKIKNPDLRHWFVLVYSLIYLSKKLNKNIKTDFEKIDLNKIYDNCFKKKHIDFNNFNYNKNKNTDSLSFKSIKNTLKHSFTIKNKNKNKNKTRKQSL